jgi:hypothetical protein
MATVSLDRQISARISADISYIAQLGFDRFIGMIFVFEIV